MRRTLLLGFLGTCRIPQWSLPSRNEKVLTAIKRLANKADVKTVQLKKILAYAVPLSVFYRVKKKVRSENSANRNIPRIGPVNARLVKKVRYFTQGWISIRCMYLKQKKRSLTHSCSYTLFSIFQSFHRIITCLVLSTSLIWIPSFVVVHFHLSV